MALTVKKVVIAAAERPLLTLPTFRPCVTHIGRCHP
jgi:hypothetical protein